MKERYLRVVEAPKSPKDSPVFTKRTPRRYITHGDVLDLEDYRRRKGS